MAYDRRVMKTALARYEADRAARELRRQERVDALLRRQPRLAEIQRELRSTMAHVVASAFRAGTDPAPVIRALGERNLELQRERAELLREAGYEPDFLEEKPNCPLCGDQGFTDHGPCRCLMAYYTREQNRELSRLLDLGSQSFETFRFDVYDDIPRPELGKSPRQVMEKIYDECRDYAREFGPRSGNLLFTGAPGLGKTFLSACIAREVSDAGFSVVYDTAGHVFSQFEREKFGRDNPYEESADAEVNRCLNCDLLILDDLGSEMTTAFVQSALYQIVNGRLISGRQTIISTNLRPNEIGERYSPAILSRIRGAYQIKAFFGRDLRTPPDRT